MENHSLPRALILALVLTTGARAADSRAAIDSIAERYVRLQLAIGVHDPDHVGWYYGPRQWRTQAEAAR